MCERRNNLSKPSGEKGYSLLEVILAITIFMVAMAAIFGVLRIGLITRDTINDRGETVSNARTAVNAVGREAVNAGLGFSRVGAIVPDDYLKDLLNFKKDSGKLRDLFTGVVGADELNASELSLTGEKNDVIGFIYRDLNFNNGLPIIILDAESDDDDDPILLDTGINGCVNCNKYDVYVVEDAEGNQALAMATRIISNRYIEIAPNDPLDLNRYPYEDDDMNDPTLDQSILTKCPVGQTANCFTYLPQATAKRVFISSYSVDDEGTLVRTVFGNNTGQNAAEQIQVQPLSYGVQRFQVKYLMQDGTKIDDPSEDNTNHARMNEIVQVEIKITIKAEGNEQGVTSTQIINLTSTFSTRNLRYDIE